MGSGKSKFQVMVMIRFVFIAINNSSISNKLSVLGIRTLKPAEWNWVRRVIVYMWENWESVLGYECLALWKQWNAIHILSIQWQSMRIVVFNSYKYPFSPNEFWWLCCINVVVSTPALMRTGNSELDCGCGCGCHNNQFIVYGFGKGVCRWVTDTECNYSWSEISFDELEVWRRALE